jgi:hypothetical protein
MRGSRSDATAGPTIARAFAVLAAEPDLAYDKSGAPHFMRC